MLSFLHLIFLLSLTAFGCSSAAAESFLARPGEVERVVVGMSRGEVIRLVGKPKAVAQMETKRQFRWRYPRGIVVFSKSKVVETRAFERMGEEPGPLSRAASNLAAPAATSRAASSTAESKRETLVIPGALEKSDAEVTELFSDISAATRAAEKKGLASGKGIRRGPRRIPPR